MREECRYSLGSVLLAVGFGGIVGAGFALLLAPQSGRETRLRIRELADDASVKAKYYAGEVKGKISTGVDKGKEYYREKKSNITAAIDAGKETY